MDETGGITPRTRGLRHATDLGNCIRPHHASPASTQSPPPARSRSTRHRSRAHLRLSAINPTVTRRAGGLITSGARRGARATDPRPSGRRRHRQDRCAGLGVMSCPGSPCDAVPAVRDGRPTRSFAPDPRHKRGTGPRPRPERPRVVRPGMRPPTPPRPARRPAPPAPPARQPRPETSRPAGARPVTAPVPLRRPSPGRRAIPHHPAVVMPTWPPAPPGLRPDSQKRPAQRQPAPRSRWASSP